MSFWSRLRETIKERNLSQEGIARTLKIPIGTFKNWLLRETYPDAREAVEIAKLLNTSVEYLVNGKDRAGFTEEERCLINGFRRLSKNDQARITIIIEAWLKKFKDN